MGNLKRADSPAAPGVGGWLLHRIAPQEEALLARPQRLGLLPSHAFWRQWSNFKRVLPILGLVGVATFALIMAFPAVLGWPVLLVATLVGVNELTIGIVERYVRKEATKRVAKQTPKALPTG